MYIINMLNIYGYAKQCNFDVLIASISGELSVKRHIVKSLWKKEFHDYMGEIWIRKLDTADMIVQLV
jgi:hypothetical protein